MVEVSSKRSIAIWALLTLLMACLFVSLVAAGTASAQPEGARIKSYLNERSTDQAGAHPDVYFEFEVGTRADPFIPDSCFCNTIKDAILEFPTGFIGNPHAVPECTAAQFTFNQCPIDSQVGMAYPENLISDEGNLGTPKQPLYNLVPQPGQAGLQAFTAPFVNFPVYTVITPRTNSDYGLNGEVKGILSSYPLFRFKQELWGIPALPSHDALRARATAGGSGFEAYPNPSNSPRLPYLSNPTTCVGPLTTILTTLAYDGGVHQATAPWGATTGCDQLTFNPSLAANPTTEDADSASGIDVLFKALQPEGGDTPLNAEIKRTTVTFPPGFSINSSSADGKTACSDAEARFGTREEAQCPDFSKVGIFTVNASGLPKPISGGIFLGEPLPGNRYRIFITADGYGTHVKLPGSAYPDPQTGQLTTTFDNLP
ncbi:MAG: hypothetical protein ABW065_13295, partial [Solirubrobacterales bacterium]